MAKSERSAGFVVFHVDPETRRRRYLLLDYGRYWDFPKGHLEKGEDDLTAARRELHEETGIVSAIAINGFAREINYFYYANRRPVNKAVIFFVAETTTTDIVISDEHVDSGFFEFHDAMAKLKYPNSREVLRGANAFLDSKL